jgi:trans-aconitate methyltransferase
LSINDEIKRIKKLSNERFYKMLKLVELGLSNWWTASAILSIAYDNLTEEQKKQIRQSYEEKLGEQFPNIDPFLELGKNENKFEVFFLSYENHIRFHKSGSKADPNCSICELEKLFV